MYFKPNLNKEQTNSNKYFCHESTALGNMNPTNLLILLAQWARFPPPLKHEAPFQEKISRKNTKNKNSKSSKYFKNMCEEVLFSKSAGLQDYSWQFS